jgi:hypothetical protein
VRESETRQNGRCLVCPCGRGKHGHEHREDARRASDLENQLKSTSPRGFVAYSPPSTNCIRRLLPLPAAPTAINGMGSINSEGSINLWID